MFTLCVISEIIVVIQLNVTLQFFLFISCKFTIYSTN
jgi:hypothetical protein